MGQTTGYKLCSVGYASGSGTAWITPSNVVGGAINPARTASLSFVGATTVGQTLIGAGFIYDNLPPTATVTGVGVRLGLTGVGNVATDSVNIGFDDATLGTPKTSGATIDAVTLNYFLGGDGDAWGLTLTASQISTPTFEARFAIRSNSSDLSNTVLAFGIWTQVFYDPGQGPILTATSMARQIRVIGA